MEEYIDVTSITLIGKEKLKKMYTVHTSFREGISNIDSGTDADTILAFSSSLLAWLDLESNLGASKYSREPLQLKYNTS